MNKDNVERSSLFVSFSNNEEYDVPVRAEDLSYIHYSHEITRKVSRISFDGSENRTKREKATVLSNCGVPP